MLPLALLAAALLLLLAAALLLRAPCCALAAALTGSGSAGKEGTENRVVLPRPLPQNIKARLPPAAHSLYYTFGNTC